MDVRANGFVSLELFVAFTLCDYTGLKLWKGKSLKFITV